MILRSATLDDAALLLRWRNDPVTIRSLPGACPTLSAAHEEWFQRRITQPNFFVAEEEGHLLGTVRLDPCFLLSITVAPEHRGKGWATPMILEAVQGAEHPVFAQILLNNQASIRAFLKAGFQLEPGQWYRNTGA